MANPVRTLLDRCKVGFPLTHKVGVTALVMLYVVSPVDLWPEPLLPPFSLSDDVLALYLLVRVWMSPTLPAMPSRDDGPAPGAGESVTPAPTESDHPRTEARP